jgi:hypothetical protein
VLKSLCTIVGKGRKQLNGVILLNLAKWMTDACVPFNVVNSVYYQHAIDAVTAMNPSYKRPNLHAIHGYYLAKAVDKVKIYVESY